MDSPCGFDMALTLRGFVVWWVRFEGYFVAIVVLEDVSGGNGLHKHMQSLP